MHRIAMVLIVLTVSCDGLTDPPKAAAPPDVTIQFEPDTLEADGASYTTVRIDVTDSTKAGPGIVVLRVSTGFIGSTADTNAATLALGEDGQASTRWTAPTISGVGQAIVIYGETVTTDSVAFIPAGPESVRLSTSSFAVPATPAQSITLTLHTERTPGKVSERPGISWAATDSSGAPIGEFGAETWGSGAASISFTAGPTDYRGPVHFTATVSDIPSATLSDNIRAWVTDPS